MRKAWEQQQQPQHLLDPSILDTDDVTQAHIDQLQAYEASRRHHLLPRPTSTFPHADDANTQTSAYQQALSSSSYRSGSLYVSDDLAPSIASQYPLSSSSYTSSAYNDPASSALTHGLWAHQATPASISSSHFGDMSAYPASTDATSASWSQYNVQLSSELYLSSGSSAHSTLTRPPPPAYSSSLLMTTQLPCHMAEITAPQQLSTSGQMSSAGALLSANIGWGIDDPGVGSSSMLSSSCYNPVSTGTTRSGTPAYGASYLSSTSDYVRQHAHSRQSGKRKLTWDVRKPGGLAVQVPDPEDLLGMVERIDLADSEEEDVE